MKTDHRVVFRNRMSSLAFIRSKQANVALRNRSISRSLVATWIASSSCLHSGSPRALVLRRSHPREQVPGRREGSIWAISQRE
jgi:hypothetical protein